MFQNLTERGEVEMKAMVNISENAVKEEKPNRPTRPHDSTRTNIGKLAWREEREDTIDGLANKRPVYK